MSIFFDREETDTHVLITISPWWLYVSMGLIALMLVPRLGQDAGGEVSTVSTVALWVLIVVALWRFVQRRGVRREIFRAMKDRTIEMSGSRFNPNAPMKIRIGKQGTQAADKEESGAPETEIEQ